VGAKRRYLAAFVGGLVFFIPALNWIRVAHPMMMLFAWPGLSVACALFWPLALLLLRKLDRLQLPFAVTLPVVWVGLDYLRAHFPTGFPFLKAIGAHQLSGFGWYFLGYPMHDFTALTQAADLGGVYLISVAVAAINGAIADWLYRAGAVRSALRWSPDVVPALRPSILIASIGSLVLPLLLIGYGLARLDHAPFTAGPRIAAIQGNLAQDDKIIRGEQAEGVTETPLQREYFPIADEAVRPKPVPDLIIWPETCFPYDWVEITDPAGAPQADLDYARVVRQTLGTFTRKRFGTANLFGLNAIEWKHGRGHKSNSALLINADGSVGGRYDKIHLVPFGEYVPLREQFPWLQVFTPYKHDYSCTPGESWTRFPLVTDRGTFHFGVLICYEDSDPYLARQYNPASGRGHAVDFLVNISNDGWFNGTEEHEQHLAICRYRAIESRRSVVRAVNMGISAVIDPDGRIIALPGDGRWANAKKVAGVVRAEVPVDSRESVYARVGDWVPAMLWAMLALGLLAGRLKRASRG
jgi:apolipoprotein N-acyltransferase